MPANLLDLPDEMLVLAVSFSQRKELKCLRLANRRLARISSENLFESIAISTTDHSIVQLLYVAGSPIYSKQVKYIDWVLLGPDDGVTMTTSSMNQHVVLASKREFRKWAKDLRGSGAKDKHYGLELQSQLVRRLPNVRFIRFWTAVEAQRDRREPWEETRKIHEAIVSNEITVRRPIHHHYLSPLDIFAILSAAKAKPTEIKTADAIMKLRWGSSKYQHSLEHLDIILRYGTCKADVYRGSMNEDERGCNKCGAENFSSLALTHFTTLKTLNIGRIVSVEVGTLHAIIDTNRRMELLSFHGSYLYCVVGRQPLLRLLEILRDYRPSRKSLQVRFDPISCWPGPWKGDFYASEEELTQWMDRDSDDLISKVEASLRKSPDPSEAESGQSEESEEEEDEGGDYWEIEEEANEEEEDDWEIFW